MFQLFGISYYTLLHLYYTYTLVKIFFISIRIVQKSLHLCHRNYLHGEFAEFHTAQQVSLR